MFVVSVDITTGLSPQVKVGLEAPEMEIAGYPPPFDYFIKLFILSIVKQQLENQFKELIKFL